MKKLVIKTVIGFIVWFTAWIIAYNQSKYTSSLWLMLLIFFAGIAAIVIAFVVSYRQIEKTKAQAQAQSQMWQQPRR